MRRNSFNENAIQMSATDDLVCSWHMSLAYFLAPVRAMGFEVPFPYLLACPLAVCPPLE